jgi:acetate kinase
MKVLVINSGSSSLKYQLIETKTRELITKGNVEKIGGDSEYGFITKDGEKIKFSVSAKTHKDAISLVIENITDKAYGFIGSLDEISAIGHRVVHGGEKFSDSVLIGDEVIRSIEHYIELAPLHNPANLQGILACKELLPGKPQVAVFDTAFHSSIPAKSFLYAIPYEYYDKYRIRRYGFHGTSHRYVTLKTSEFLNIPLDKLNIITCHLGNGSSLCAVKEGKSVDTSMGFTPLEGVVMGTRCGVIDPAISFYIMEKDDISAQQMNNILNKKSGLLGLSGISNDLREIWQQADSGNERAKITRKVLVKSIRRYIGAYMVELGRVDAIVFTAGIGENDWDIREKCVAGLEEFGIKMDVDKNKLSRAELTDLSYKDSKVKILLVPTNEELMIALDTEAILSKN